MDLKPQTGGSPVVVVIGSPITVNVLFERKCLSTTLPFELLVVLFQEEYKRIIANPKNDILQNSGEGNNMKIGIALSCVGSIPFFIAVAFMGFEIWAAFFFHFCEFVFLFVVGRLDGYRFCFLFRK